MHGNIRIHTENDGEVYQDLNALGGGTMIKPHKHLDDVIINIEFFSLKDFYERLDDLYHYLDKKFSK